MPKHLSLVGRYKLSSEAFLREKADRDDPRSTFYSAMIANRNYEDYLAEVGQKMVNVDGYKANPISGRMEILYARKHRWVEDEK